MTQEQILARRAYAATPTLYQTNRQRARDRRQARCFWAVVVTWAVFIIARLTWALAAWAGGGN